MHKHRNIISESLSEISPDEFEGNLRDLHAKITEWIVEYGPDVKVSWEPDNWLPYNDSPTPIFRFVRQRMENDVEFTARLDKIAAHEAAIEAKELAEYNRLKAKIEGKK